jgi:TetR/AcrR family transcriptional repressor of nem operon
MRYSAEHKESVRARIVEAAAKALRRSGLDGVSVPALMKKAGLTHGGFYVHFADKDELVAEAVRFAAHQTARRVFEGSAGVEEMLAAYLSMGHVDHREEGCVLGALGTEAPHQKPTVRRAFAEMARGFVRHVERKLHPKSERAKLSDEALVTASKMLGAIMLARLVDDDALAKRILAATRDSLT